MVANEGRVRKMSPADAIMIVLPGNNAKTTRLYVNLHTHDTQHTCSVCTRTEWRHMMN